jgi:hypothetical protein
LLNVSLQLANKLGIKKKSHSLATDMETLEERFLKPLFVFHSNS